MVSHRHTPGLQPGAWWLALLLVAASCDSVRLPSIVPEVEEDLLLEGVGLTVFGSGEPRLQAQVSRMRGSRNLLRLSEVRLRLSSSRGPVSVQAPQGELDPVAGRLSLSGGVRVEDSHRWVLTSQDAEMWRDAANPELRPLRASGGVGLVGVDFSMSAQALEGDLGARDFILTGPVTGTLVPPEPAVKP